MAGTPDFGPNHLTITVSGTALSEHAPTDGLIGGSDLTEPFGVRLSQEVVEALTEGATVRISQESAEVLTEGASLRVSQEVVEALVADGLLRTSQIIIEVLVPNIEVFMPIIYPQLPQWTYSVNWTPEFFNMPTQKMTTGAELDVGIAESPLHNFSLKYDCLRDTGARWGVGSSEWRIMGGFFGALGGNLGRFLFPWADDRTVTSQFIDTTDGISHLWTLKRTFGEQEYTWTEPVGYVDLTMPFRVYFDGALQDRSSYSVLQTQPGLQQLQWNGTPTAGQRITVDMSYFYYCKLPTSKLDFENIMHKLWSLKKIEFKSCRANT